MKKIYIGTSGYSYSHWKRVFYPENLPESKWLEYYAKFFSTVELNVTFYRLPHESVFKSWYKRTPKDFLFSVKGSRFITHIKKLKNVEKPLELFFFRIKFLKEKLGVILWQFPPNFKMNLERLKNFLSKLSDVKCRQVFEFRHQSWFTKEVYDLLKEYNYALVIVDSPTFPVREEITADFGYFRFHGGKILYGSEYSEKELKEWVLKIRKFSKEKNIFVYFNNDFQGFAVKNAKQLKKFLKIQ